MAVIVTAPPTEDELLKAEIEKKLIGFDRSKDILVIPERGLQFLDPGKHVIVLPSCHNVAKVSRG